MRSICWSKTNNLLQKTMYNLILLQECQKLCRGSGGLWLYCADSLVDMTDGWDSGTHRYSTNSLCTSALEVINFDYVGRQGARAVTLTNDISICPRPSPRGPDNVGVVWLGNILLSDVWRDPQWSAQGHHQHHHQPTLVFTRKSRPLQTSRRNYCVCSTPAGGCVTTTNTKKKQRGNCGPVGLHQQLAETSLKLHCLVSWLSCWKLGELLKHHKETSDKDRPALHLRRATSGG